jgi:hypothetical protein
MTKKSDLSPEEASAMAEFIRKAEHDPKIWGALLHAIYRNKGHTLSCASCDEPLSMLPMECPCCGSQEFVLIGAAGRTEAARSGIRPHPDQDGRRRLSLGATASQGGARR